MNKIINTYEKITLAIKEYNMLKPSQSVVVGLSGGADSAMLCHFLKYICNVKVIACHINHNLRGEESIRDRDFVSDFCNTHDIECHIYDCDIEKHAKENKLSIELAGRAVRYSIFEELAKSKGDDCKIATAHTLSDSVETVVFNLVRGSGIDGLCGIAPIRGNIIRPLIYCKREDIEDYCEQNDVKYVTDSTNLTTDYTRNKIRHNIITQFKEINPAVLDNVLNMIKTNMQISDFLNQSGEKLYNKLYINDMVLNIKPIISGEYHNAVVSEVIKKFLQVNEISISFELINLIQGMIISSSGKVNVSNNRFIQIKGEQLIVSSLEEKIDYFEFTCEIGEEFVSKTGKKYRVNVAAKNNLENIKKINKILFILPIDYDTIEGILVFRQRKSKDKITLSKRNCSKTIKKLFNEEKITAFERDARFVVSTVKGEDVVAIEAVGVNKKYEVTDKTQNILYIEQIL